MNELNFDYKILGKGKTVLVIETGIGSSFYDWYSLVEDLKEDFTIVLYHRCGYGKSQDPKISRTTKNISEELDYLLEKIGMKREGFLRENKLVKNQWKDSLLYSIISSDIINN